MDPQGSPDSRLRTAVRKAIAEIVFFTTLVEIAEGPEDPSQDVEDV